MRNKVWAIAKGVAAAAIMAVFIVSTGSCAHEDRNKSEQSDGRGPGSGRGAGGMPPGPPPGEFASGGPGEGPGGTPPSRGGGGTPPSGGPGVMADAMLSAKLALNSGTDAKSGIAVSATAKDQSAVWVSDGAALTLDKAAINKSGAASDREASEFYGLNAAVVASAGAFITISGSSVTSDGAGANAVVSTGRGTRIVISDTRIRTLADSSRGLHATMGGSIEARDVRIETAGEHCAAVSTDRGGGTVLVSGGIMKTVGIGSPGIYSTGDIQVEGAIITASGSEAAVIEGKNSISLKAVQLSGAKLNGVMLYQSFSGDAGPGTSRFAMEGGSLSAAEGPLFYVTNADSVVELRGVAVDAASGSLIRAASDRWGVSGRNGGRLEMRAYAQRLAGSVDAEAGSSVSLHLSEGSTLSGRVLNASVTLDSTSLWTVTGDSALLTLTLEDGVAGLARIASGGFIVTYDASAEGNAWLAGARYPLQGGGALAPRK